MRRLDYSPLCTSFVAVNCHFFFFSSFFRVIFAGCKHFSYGFDPSLGMDLFNRKEREKKVFWNRISFSSDKPARSPTSHCPHPNLTLPSHDSPFHAPTKSAQLNSSAN